LNPAAPNSAAIAAVRSRRVTMGRNSASNDFDPDTPRLPKLADAITSMT
jgi:hypothetical protein